MVCHLQQTLFVTLALAAMADAAVPRVIPLTAEVRQQMATMRRNMPEDWRVLGQVRPRSAKTIQHSLLGIGGEVLDRDPLFTRGFEMVFRFAGLEAVKLPPKSPNLNAYAGRFVRSIKGECLSKLILSSEQQLRHVLSECLEYYHHERIHQGINGVIEPKYTDCTGDVVCIERLGGLLQSYHRLAA